MTEHGGAAEREALARIVRDETGEAEEEAGFVADAILAAGFHQRQAEPSDAQADAAQRGYHAFAFGPDDADSFLTPERLAHGRAAWKAALRAAGVAGQAQEWESTTERGFGLTSIPVANYRGTEPVDFTVQMSSLASEPKVWIGVEDHRAHMNVEEATRARDALSAFLLEAKRG